MSSAEQFDRHHKQQTDRAISHAYARLGPASRARPTFTALLHCVRTRSASLFEAPVAGEHHPGIEALVNLALFAGVWQRQPSEWPGCDSSWQVSADALARHLIARYPVPSFLASAWYERDDAGGAGGGRYRDWFVAHAAGAPFRSLPLPIAMTRSMERIFLASPDHLTIPRAIRRAELIALGAGAPLVEAVLATRIADDLGNGAFWRTVWQFLIANRERIEVAQVSPIVDFLEAVRHERIAVETPAGLRWQDPPQPRFSMRGRTAQSLLRLMDAWHRGLGAATGGFTWMPSPLKPLVIEEPPLDPSLPPATWLFVELTNSEQLRQESAALRHCVASYADRCRRGASRIWSLRMQRGDRVRHVITIEVDMRRRAVVQARGWGNRPASGKPLALLRQWAGREHLELLI